MVQRTSERLDVGTGRQTDVAIPQSGRVGPTNTAGVFDQQIAHKHPDLTPVPDGRLDPIVASLFKVGMGVIGEQVQRREQQAYLNGALAVGQGLTEEQIESNPLTRRWAQAGYRDMVGRLALANNEAEIAKDMERLRERSPAEMAAYLKNRRDALMPTLDRMSGPAKEQLFQQLLTSEQASLSAHMKAHQEFIVENTMKPIRTILTTGIEKLQATGGPSDPRYNTELASLAAKVDSHIWQNTSLTQGMKVKLTTEAAMAAMADGDLGFYTVLREGVITNAEGELERLWDQLPFNVRASITKQARITEGQNSFRHHREWYDADMAYETALASGQAIDPSAYMYHLENGVQSGTITPAQRTARAAQAARNQAMASQAITLNNAVARGDYGTIDSMGVSRREASKAFMRTMLTQAEKEGRPLGEVFQTAYTVAVETGNDELLALSGELLSPTLSTLMYAQEGEIDSNTASVMTNWSRMVDFARSKGNTTALTSAIRLLPEDQQEFMLTYFDIRSSNYQTEDGTLNTTGREKDIVMDARRSMAQRGIEGPKDMVQYERDVEKATIDLSSTGKLGQITGAIGAVFNPAKRAELALTKTGRWLTNDTVYANQRYAVERALDEERRSLMRTRAGAPPEVIADLALLRVQDRTIETDRGMVILPQGSDIRSIFNPKESAASPETIGIAFNRLYKATDAPEGAAANIWIDGGEVQVRYINDDGEQIQSTTFTTEEVKREAEAYIEGRDITYNEIYGEGKVQSGTTGVQVRYNGATDAPISEELALKARDLLVRFEDVRDEPYEDGVDRATGKKKYSVGVGVNTSNTYYPRNKEDFINGKLTQEAMTRSFTLASNEAMNAALYSMITSDVPTNNEDMFLLFTAMAYQGGPQFINKKSGIPFRNALKGNDPEAAVAALKNTLPYKYAHDERRDWYEQQVRKYFNQ